MNLYSLPPLFTLIAFLSLALITIVRWRNEPVNRLFLLICILGAGLYADILFIFNTDSARKALLVTRIDQFFSLFLIPLYVHFLHAYLEIGRRRWLLGIFYTVPGVLVWFGWTPLLIESMHRFPFGYFGQAGTLYPVVALSATCATAYGGWILGRALLRSRDRALRRRMQYLLVGFVSIAVLTGLNFFPLYGYPLYPPGNFCFVPLLIFAVGLFRHDLLNMGLLIKRGLIYSLLMAALTGIYAVVVVAVNGLLGATGLSSTLMVNLLLFVVIAFVFGPLKTGIRKAVDRAFSRRRYDYRQVVQRNSRLIATVCDIPAIARTLVETIVKAMGVVHCQLYLRAARSEKNELKQIATQASGPAQSPLRLTDAGALQTHFKHQPGPYRKNTRQIPGPSAASRLLDEVLEQCRAVLAVPLHFQGELRGLVLVGEKACGAPYVKEDCDLLETLAGHAGLAVENARAYQTLARLNQDLEQRVAERTRSLQAALAEKERTLEQLVRSESLAAIGQLVAGVAHELNNPLASVKSLLQSVLEELEQAPVAQPIEPELRDDLHFADQELDRASGIVASLLGLSRQTQTYSEPVDVNQVVCAALRILQNKYKQRDLVIRQSLAAQLPAIRGNYANLGQVALNLISNAIDALPVQKGVVDLATGYREKTGAVVFECRDNGSGIPADIRDDIFKPFFTTKPVGSGTGLGLYICHEIVARHGGTISVNSLPNSGTRIRVILPIGGHIRDTAASIDIAEAGH